MQRIFIVSSFLKPDLGLPEIVGITLNPDNILKIINNYIHYRIQDAEDWSNPNIVAGEEENGDVIWKQFKDCNFNEMTVGSSKFCSGDYYGIEVSVHYLYESSGETDKELNYDGELSDVSLPF